MEKNRYVHYGIVLTVIAFLAAFILAFVNDFTAPKIAENTRKAVNQARIRVLPLASDFKEEDAKSAEGLDFIPGKNESGERVGYVVSAATNGYAGPINFVLGFDLDGKITGLAIVSSQETPGLGSKINNDSWKNLWIGRDSSHEFNKSVDAFAGATISPEAVYVRMMEVLNIFKSEVK